MVFFGGLGGYFTFSSGKASGKEALVLKSLAPNTHLRALWEPFIISLQYIPWDCVIHGEKKKERKESTRE